MRLEIGQTTPTENKYRQKKYDFQDIPIDCRE